MAGDDFAELLRTLKERSGLSYGVLGKRLHMSASTLHRYVNGDVVPVEYAPVERLARVCRATPDELLELHRRWVRADALRGVKGEPGPTAAPGTPGSAKTPGTPGASGPAKAAGAAGAAGGAGAAGTPSGAPETAATAPDAPAGAPDAPAGAPDDPAASATGAEPGALAEGAPGEGPDAGTGTGTRTDAGTDARTGGDADAGTEATSAGGGADPTSAAPADTGTALSAFDDPVTRLSPAASTPRSRRPRRTALLAGGGVAAVAAVALLVSLLPGGDDRGTGAAKGAAASVSPERSSAHASRKASESASTSPSPTALKKHSASPKATATRAGGSGGSGGAHGSSGVPLAVTTNPYYWDAPCEQAFLLDRRPENVPPPPTEQQVVGWITPFGGVAADSQMVSLTLQGTGAETVVLRELHVRVVSSNPPLNWSKYAMGVGCGGGVNTKSFDVSLDQGNPLAMPVAGQRDFPYKVSESDPEVFFVNAHTSGHDVRWYLELDWSSGDRSGTLRVDDHGKPFRTSAGERSYYAYALTGDAGWERVDNPN
ncbi:helix-turn-helix domain-containing protein [Streptomyces jietaisiensis]|uniref:Helix-turn-helix domain-containing protein n=1 Tax=Streptomyces griseoaurantiacus TaxID=68213 RepID=A0ABZ1V0T4_9ACTN|nr:helix-turn-helix transcriptional regulator [Streptomyces jietaisiensis]